MKILFRLMNLLLCFELIVGPMAPQLSLLSIGHASAEECPSGFQFDSTLNRCITSEQMATIMNAVSTCNGDKACYRQNAESALKAAEEEGKVEKQIEDKSGLINKGMKAGAVAVPLALGAGMLWKGRQEGGPKCGSMSLYAMMGAGVAVFVGDWYANSRHKKKLKEVEKEWNEIVNPTSEETKTTDNADSTKVKATEGQSQAFEMLAKSEDSMAGTAKFKAGVYGTATAAFAAAGVLAAMELYTLQGLKRAKDSACSGPQSATLCTPAINAYQLQYSKSYCTNATAPGAENPTVTPPVSNPTSGPTVGPNVFNNHLKSSKDLPSLMTLYFHSTDSNLTKASPTLDQYENYKKHFSNLNSEDQKNVFNLLRSVATKTMMGLNPLPSAIADETPGADANPDANAGGGGITDIMRPAMGQLRRLNNFLYSPQGRIAISGIFAGWSGIMTMHAMKQAKVSSNRAKHLRGIKETFNDATGAINGCTPADRGNTAKPNCYCYTDAGARNAERSASAICIALFTGKNLKADDYANKDLGSQKVCITTAGAIDESCSCATTKTCSDTMPSNITGLSTGSLSLLSSALTPADQLANGQLAAGSVNGAAAVSNAMKVLDAKDKLESQIGDKSLKSQKDKIAKEVENGLIAASAGVPSNMLGSNSSLPMNMSPAQAALELEKEIKASKVNHVSSGAPMGGSAAAPEQALEFGMTQQDLAGQQTELAEVMGQKLDFRENDITPTSDTNIFKVLSNRYQRSGMRRLFDAEGKTQPEKASNTDITK